MTNKFKKYFINNIDKAEEIYDTIVDTNIYDCINNNQFILYLDKIKNPDIKTLLVEYLEGFKVLQKTENLIMVENPEIKFMSEADIEDLRCDCGECFNYCDCSMEKNGIIEWDPLLDIRYLTVDLISLFYVRKDIKGCSPKNPNRMIRLKEEEQNLMKNFKI